MYSPIIAPMRRRGSLNLSINAIVALILAITMLGLGLGFIRNIFGGAAGKVGQALEATSLKNPADSSNPVTIEDKITIKRRGQREIEIGFYNTEPSEVSSISLTLSKCTDSTGRAIIPASDLVTLAAPSQDLVGPSDGTGFKAIMSATEAAAAGTYICQIDVIGTPEGGSDGILRSKQFFVQVAT